MENDAIYFRLNKMDRFDTFKFYLTTSLVAGVGSLILLQGNRLDEKIDQLLQSQTPHTETFGAEAEQRRYVEVIVEGKPVKAYFEINAQPAQDYINQGR